MATKKKIPEKATEIEPYKCLPLEENLAPKWTSPQDFEQWHVGIWRHKVDPGNFGADVFTQNCVMEGPRPEDRIAGPWKNPLNGKLVYPNQRAANFFAGVFLLYPNLSGEHISWAYNDNQVFFNWCFVTTGGNEVLRVPAMDVFCIDKGKVAYRSTEFDMDTLQEALKTAYRRKGAPAHEQVPMGYLWTRLHREPTLPALPSLR